MTDDLMPVLPAAQTPARKLADSDLPAAIKAAGHASAFAYEEFLFGQIRNKHTSRAYTHAVKRFLAWVHIHELSLPHITPKDVSKILSVISSRLSPHSTSMAA